MLSQPTNMSPRITDATEPFDFTFQFHGSDLEGYAYEIIDANGTVYLSEGMPTITTETHPLGTNYVLDNYIRLPRTVFNNEFVTVRIPAIRQGENAIFVNGQSYFLNLRLKQTSQNIFRAGQLIAKGNIVTSESGIDVTEPTSHGFWTTCNMNVKTGMYIIMRETIRRIWWLFKVPEWGIMLVVLEGSTAFPFTPENNERFEIRSDFIDIYPEHELLARRRSEISVEAVSGIDSETYKINSPTADFLGRYSKNDGVPVAYYKVEIYKYDDATSNYDFITESGEINNESYRFTYNGFLPGELYKIIFTVENAEGVIYAANVFYETEYEVVHDAIKSQIDYDFDNDRIQVSFDFTGAFTIWNEPENGKRIETMFFRQRKNSDTLEFAGQIVNDRVISDYNIFADTEYRYILRVSLFNADSRAWIFFVCTTDYVRTCNAGWSVTELTDGENPNEYFIADNSNRWIFDLNLSSGAHKQNFHKNVNDALGKYPKIARGGSDYASSNISALIGKVVQNRYIDTKEMLEEWNEFAYSDGQKLLKDRKGNKYLIDIIATQFDYADNTSEQAVNVSFDFAETGSLKNCSIIGKPVFSDNNNFNYAALELWHDIQNVISTNANTDCVLATNLMENDVFGGLKKWSGGVLAPNEKMYALSGTERLAVIDYNAGRADIFGGFSNGFGNSLWFGGVLGFDNKIYSAPNYLRQVLQIDPADRNKTEIFGYIELSVGGSYSGCVLAPNGLIYGIPSGADRILVIDGGNRAVSYLNYEVPFYDDRNRGAVHAPRFVGGVLAPNGKIYGIPHNANVILEIDPVNKTAVTFGVLPDDESKWSGGVLATSGKIYCIPHNSDSVLIIDPAHQSFEMLDIGIAGEGKWAGGVLAHNGKIYGIPHNHNYVLEIDPTNNSWHFVGNDLTYNEGKWLGGVLASNGKIYGIPYNSPAMLEISLTGETDALTQFSENSLLSAWVNKF